MYKVIVSQKKESTLNHWNESFLKRIPSRFMLTSTWNISILPPHLLCEQTWENLIFALVWMKMQIHSLPLGATFGALKIAVSSVTAVHKAALRSQTLLYQALQAWWNKNETNRTNHSRLASRKGGVWKNSSLNESFGNRWANKANKCFLTVHACQPVVGDSQKPKY